MYFAYALKSKKDNNLYIGFSNNIERRLAQHNSGKVRSTKHRIPFMLVYQEEFKTKEEAIKKEKFLKSGCGREFIKEFLSLDAVELADLPIGRQAHQLEGLAPSKA